MIVKKNKKVAVFLLDSGQSSSTEAMIKIFKTKMKDEAFKKMAANGDDELLDSETFIQTEWDESEWEWK